jgi:hypothetical protein
MYCSTQHTYWYNIFTRRYTYRLDGACSACSASDVCGAKSTNELRIILRLQPFTHAAATAMRTRTRITVAENGRTECLFDHIHTT